MAVIGDQNRALEALRLENEVLRNFVDTSKDALFCIEFLEPVDLTAPEPEIIRQVFENDCVWRMCNHAMARLYKLPEDLDFNAQNVRFVFPRNRENEQFVRTLLEADFDMDGAISLDQDYDGREILMENDVRGQIEDGKLYRMMGAVRNRSQQKIREQALNDRLDAMSSVLSAIPDPVLVIDDGGILQAVNPALEWSFGWRLDDILGQPVHDVIQFPDGYSFLADVPPAGEGGARLSLSILNAAGNTHPCDAHLSSFSNALGERRFVIVLRSSKPIPALLPPEQGREPDYAPARSIERGRRR